MKLHRGRDATAVLDVKRPREDFEAAPRSAPVRIGDMLVAQGQITKDQLTQALLLQAGTGGRLGEVLVGMGALGERDFLVTLAAQLQIPLVDLRTATPEPDALAL